MKPALALAAEIIAEIERSTNAYLGKSARACVRQILIREFGERDAAVAEAEKLAQAAEIAYELAEAAPV